MKFETIDMRGKNGFPVDERGFVFVHKDERLVHCRHTGLPVQLRDTYLIRTDNEGWRIDRQDYGPLFEAVYGPNRESHFSTKQEAVAALAAHLEKVASRAVIS